MENEALLKQLLEVFFQINTEPSDEQFHDLARSLGMDPPTLEAISYKMNAESEGPGMLTSGTEAEDVLDGDYDSNTTSPDDLMLNDGVPGGDDADTNQDVLFTDGVGPEDTGVDVSNDQAALNTDGAPGMKIAALARLRATAVQAAKDHGDLAMTKASHLSKSKYTLAQLAQEDAMQGGTVYALKLVVPGPSEPKFIFAWSYGTGAAGSMKTGDKARFRNARVTVEGRYTIKNGKVSGDMEGARSVYVFK